MPGTLADLIGTEGKSGSFGVPITQPIMMITITAVAPASVEARRRWNGSRPFRLVPGTRRAEGSARLADDEPVIAKRVP